jgi:hypothetical protein
MASYLIGYASRLSAASIEFKALQLSPPRIILSKRFYSPGKRSTKIEFEPADRWRCRPEEYGIAKVVRNHSRWPHQAGFALELQFAKGPISALGSDTQKYIN